MIITTQNDKGYEKGTEKIQTPQLKDNKNSLTVHFNTKKCHTSLTKHKTQCSQSCIFTDKCRANKGLHFKEATQLGSRIIVNQPRNDFMILHLHRQVPSLQRPPL